MIQSIYTSVSNADIVPCGKKGQKVSSEPIPLLRNNYLGEYRTELEKAKVRKNLGIADDAVIEWGNITGHIEDNPDLREALSYKLPKHLEDIIKEDFTSIKSALNWAIEYLSTFVTDTESIAWLKDETANIRQSIQEKEIQIYTQINSLSESVQNNINSITEEIQGSIQSINDDIKKLNDALKEINVDQQIKAWVDSKIKGSKTLTIQDDKLETKVSEVENNALVIKDNGLFVENLSNTVKDATDNIKKIQDNIDEIRSSFVTKEELGGGGSFDFVNQEDFTDSITDIQAKLDKTVKTGEDGHVNTLYVNKLSNQKGNIKIDKSLEVQSGVPLDIRTVVGTTEDLYKIDPKVAYKGMAVANASNGYIYILMDPTSITEKSSWKASYESIQIITCTQEEYEAMAANTNDDYTYKEEGKPFLYEDTYYYIYENEEKSQYYVTAKQIEEWLKAKASAADVAGLSSKFSEHVKNYESTVEQLDTLSQDISDNYNTAEQIAGIYATKEALQDTDSKFENYSTSEEITKTLEDYVTKDSLRGGLEGEDDFVFVTQNQYNADKEANLEKITTTQLVLTQDEIENSISVLDFDLSVNNKPLAYREEVPKIQLVETKAEFEEMEKDSDTYYYICDDETIGYLTNITAGEQFYTKLQVNNLIAQATQKLIDEYIVPLQQEIAALKGAQS